MSIEKFEKQELNGEQALFIRPNSAALSDLTITRKIIRNYIISELENEHFDYPDLSCTEQSTKPVIDCITIVGCKTLNKSELVCLVVARYTNNTSETTEILIKDINLNKNSVFPNSTEEIMLIVDKILIYKSFEEMLDAHMLLLNNNYETTIIPIVPKQNPSAAIIKYVGG